MQLTPTVRLREVIALRKESETSHGIGSALCGQVNAESILLLGVCGAQV
jgi:hypothetical protein